MKKQMKWLLAALALAALATPAFAVTADMTGTLSVRAIATNNFDGTDSDGLDAATQDHSRFMDQRFRLFTSVAANENVKAVLGLEVDNVLGRTNTTTSGAAGKDLGAMGTDDTAKMEIKHLYLDFKIPATGTMVKAGSQPFNFGRGMVINDDAAGLVITQPCPVMPDNKLELSWIKTAEGEVTTSTSNPPAGRDLFQNESDGDFYGAKYTMKVAGIAIAPYAGYYTSGTNSITKTETDAGFAGVDVDGKAGAFGYALTALYNKWTNNVTDGGSISLYGKGTLDMGATTLSLEAARMGDEDNGGNAMSLAQNAATGPVVNVSEITTGGLYTSNSALAANIGGAATLYTTNWLYVKVGAVQKLNDSMKVSAYIAHIQEAADSGPAAADKSVTVGQEVDAYFDYTIVPGLGLNVMGAYLFADNDFGAGDDAYKLATSLNYKF